MEKLDNEVHRVNRYLRHPPTSQHACMPRHMHQCRVQGGLMASKPPRQAKGQRLGHSSLVLWLLYGLELVGVISGPLVLGCLLHALNCWICCHVAAQDVSN